MENLRKKYTEEEWNELLKENLDAPSFKYAENVYRNHFEGKELSKVELITLIKTIFKDGYCWSDSNTKVIDLKLYK